MITTLGKKGVVGVVNYNLYVIWLSKRLQETAYSSGFEKR